MTGGRGRKKDKKSWLACIDIAISVPAVCSGFFVHNHVRRFTRFTR